MSFAFVGAPLDRAEHLRNSPSALAALWPQARLLLLDAEGNALAAADEALLTVEGAAVAPALPEDAVFLGLHGERGWFALPAEQAGIDAPGRINLRGAAAAWPLRESTAFAQARAVLHWRSRHRYCGACGGPLAFARAGWLGECARCNIEHYPRTDPAVIVSVSDGERLLLGREASWPARRWSVLAGFVEPGETLEQTVMREVFEESQVRVRACRYLGSQPWPFPSSLMLGFEADAEPDDPVPNPDELEDVRWFTREEIGAALRGETEEEGVLLSAPVSISRWLIERWYRA
ncbi:MAG TPA: NAD(+) diphosphatase [Candidatus Luteimonas excrementigallinarum]|nr:NAD(+) diphosphatase [Candidatus Luteimonas excrementigallinarum]